MGFRQEESRHLSDPIDRHGLFNCFRPSKQQFAVSAVSRPEEDINVVARHHGRLALGCNSLLLLLGLQDRFVQLCERSMAAVLPPEGHAPEIVRTLVLDQQGSIDLGRRWLGACVNDVPPGGDATVDAEYVRIRPTL